MKMHFNDIEFAFLWCSFLDVDLNIKIKWNATQPNVSTGVASNQLENLFMETGVLWVVPSLKIVLEIFNSFVTNKFNQCMRRF